MKTLTLSLLLPIVLAGSLLVTGCTSDGVEITATDGAYYETPDVYYTDSYPFYVRPPPFNHYYRDAGHHEHHSTNNRRDHNHNNHR